MITYSFENRNGKSLQEFLYGSIRKDIISGMLRPGEKLPSKRAFASNNGISVVTVENVYGQLQAEGYIYSKPKSGFFVSEIGEDLFPARQKNAGVRKKAGRILLKEEREEKRRFRYNLVSNSTARGNFPFATWAKIMRKTLTEKEEELLNPPPTGGVAELREAIVEHLREFRGIDVSPEQVITGAGAEYLYGLIVQLLGRDRVYGLENPGPTKIRNIYRALGVRTEMLEMDHDGILTAGGSADRADIIQTSPSHQFPRGIVTSVGRRLALLKWASLREDRYLIEDDFDSEFRLQGRPIESLFSLDETDRVIYINTFTKSLSSTIRISYMVLPPPLLEKFRRELGFYACTVSNFEQYALAAFIRDGYFEKHINRMRKHYRILRDRLMEELRATGLGSRISISEEDSGLHFLMKVDTTLSDGKLKEIAAERGILVSFLTDYLEEGSDPGPYEHTAVINYSGLSWDEPAEVARLLYEAWG